MPLVRVEHLSKVYRRSSPVFGAATSQFRAVDDVTLDIEEGETLGLVGESGSGKTTLGRLILRLLEPSAGKVYFSGQEITNISRSTLRALRREMQIVFQDPFGSLDPRMTVQDIVTEPIVIHDGGHLSPAELARRAADLLRAVGLDESARARYSHEFSGGQRQRIVIARALALRPRFIVADEPVSALDVCVGAQIVNLLAQLQREFKLTYLLISHSMPVVRYLSTRIAVMQSGRIVEVGPVEEITRSPRHPYTRTLLAATPEIAPA